MAKAVFKRIKPHVNVTARRLTELGISVTGAYQAARGLAVANAADRQRLAEILAAMTPCKGNSDFKVNRGEFEDLLKAKG